MLKSWNMFFHILFISLLVTKGSNSKIIAGKLSNESWQLLPAIWSVSCVNRDCGLCGSQEPSFGELIFPSCKLKVSRCCKDSLIDQHRTEHNTPSWWIKIPKCWDSSHTVRGQDLLRRTDCLSSSTQPSPRTETGSCLLQHLVLQFFPGLGWQPAKSNWA